MKQFLKFIIMMGMVFAIDLIQTYLFKQTPPTLIQIIILVGLFNNYIDISKVKDKIEKNDD